MDWKGTVIRSKAERKEERVIPSLPYLGFDIRNSEEDFSVYSDIMGYNYP